MSFPSPLKDSVLATYAFTVSFGHSLLLVENDGKVKGLSGLDGRDCFDRHTGLICTPSGSILIVFKLELDKSLDFDGLIRANNTTSLSDGEFNNRSRESLSPEVLIRK